MKKRVKIEFNNRGKSPLGIKFIEKIASGVFNREGFFFLKNKNIEISVVTLSKPEIKKINRIYRKMNQTTDILSFAEYKNKQDMKKALAKEREVFLGELILCYNDIAAYSRKNGKNLKKELAEVIAHGLLHLLGWKHGKKMFKIQERIAQIIK